MAFIISLGLAYGAARPVETSDFDESGVEHCGLVLDSVWEKLRADRDIILDRPRPTPTWAGLQTSTSFADSSLLASTADLISRQGFLRQFFG